MPWNFPAGSMVNDSRSLALRVHLPASGVTRTIIFDSQLTIAQACEHIQAQLREADHVEHVKDYGLFLPHEDEKKGLWLENSRTLEHYILRNGDTVEFRNRYRWLYIKTMDGTRKTLRVDDSKTVAELMLLICTKMGIYNHEEYSLIREHPEHAERDARTGTLRKSGGGTGQTGGGAGGHGAAASGVGTLGRDQEKMERLKRKLHTDDDMDWLNPAQSLRQHGIDEKEVLLLKRRYFFSDMNIDSRDPIQLNLLYVQLKDAILKGTHPVSQDEAVHLAGFQCQVQFGDYQPERFQHNIFDPKEFLPKEYAKIRTLAKKVIQQHAELRGLSEIEAKSKYCQFCRSLKTYGITFFLVKERIKGKNKLIPRLLGVTKDSVIRLDEKTKQVLKIWPLTSISRWAASLHAFTMDFGEYSPDDCYTAQTSEGEQISQLIAGYVDIITKKQKAKNHPGIQGDEESAMYEENVRAERATIVQHKPARPMETVNGAGLPNHDQFDQTLSSRHETLLQSGVTPPVAQHAVQSTGGLDTNGWATGSASTAYHQFVQERGGRTLTQVDSTRSGLSNAEEIGAPGRLRQMSPDNFMIGGTHIFYYHQLTPAQRALLVTIDDDIEKLKTAKEQLYIDHADDQTVFGLGSDEASRRWLDESMGASQAKVTDEVGAMNAAVAQALRSANHAETLESDSSYQHRTGTGSAGRDPGDDLMAMQQSFRVVTIHFPAFVDDVKRVAVLRKGVGSMRADEMMMAGSAEHPTAVAMRQEAEQSSNDLMSAARNVADAFTELLESARPVAAGQVHEEMMEARRDQVDHHAAGGTTVSTSCRKAIIEAAGRVGEASNDLLRHVMRETGDEQLVTEEERLYQDQLLYLAKAVANATAGLVVKTKQLATQPCLEPDSQHRVVAAATQTGLCTSQLVACTKVLAPTIHQPSCQQQLSEAAREVTWAVDGVVQASRAAGLTAGLPAGSDLEQQQQQQALHSAVTETETAATEVRDALDQLNAHLLRASPRAFQDDALENFQTAYADLQQFHTNNGQRMVAAARRLAQATAQMIADVKAQGELMEDDPDKQARLFNAANQLADATTVLINAAKVCSSNPDNLRYQTELRDAADRLNQITQSAMAEPMQTRLIRSLQAAVRATVTGATQLVNVTRAAAGQSRGNTHQVLYDAKCVDNLIPRTLVSIRDSRVNPEDPMTQLELILTSERFLQPCESLLRSSQSITPTVSDPSLQAALDQATSQLSGNVEVLLLCLTRLAPLTRQLKIDGALARLARLVNEAAGIEADLERNLLVPLPDEKPEDCFRFLSLSVNDATAGVGNLHSLVQALAKLQPSLVNQPDACGIPAINLASSMAGLVQATRGVVANDAAAAIERQRQGLASPTARASMSARLEMTQDMQKAVQLAHELVKLASDVQHLAITTTGSQQALASLSGLAEDSNQVVDQLNLALERCLRGLPGQRDISEAIHVVATRRSELEGLAQAAPTRSVRFVEPDEFQRTHADFTQVAVEFNQATGDLLASYSPGTFRRSTRRFTGAFDQFTDKGVELSTRAVQYSPEEQPPAVNQQLVHGLLDVSDQSYVLLQEAGRVCSRPAQQDLRTRFQAAARDVTDSVSHLLTSCTVGVRGASGAPGEHPDCRAAISRLEALRPLLENPVRPVNQHAYYECVDAVARSLSPLIEGLRSMSTSAKERRGPEFTSAVHQCADSFCEIVEETAQAAFLMGASDPWSGLTSSGPLVNTQLFLRTQREIQSVCEAICDPKVSDQQVISLSTEMARSAKTLCEACSALTAQTQQPESRRQLANLTQETMHALTVMIQQLNQTRAPLKDRQTSLVNARAVGSSVSRLTNLVTGLSTAEPSGGPAGVSLRAKEAQLPVSLAGLTSLSAAQNVLRAAEGLYANAHSSKAEESFLDFSNSSKELSDSIRVLAAAMRENAPGQWECQKTLENIPGLLRDLQQAKIASMEDRVPPRRELSEEGFQKQLAACVRAIHDITPVLDGAARSECERLGHAVRQLDSYLPGLTECAIASASRSPLSSTQLVYLEHASAIVEAVDQMVSVAKEAGGNSRATHLHPSLDAASKGLMKSCEDLLAALDDISSQQGHVSTLIDSMNRAIRQTESIVQVPVNARFSDYQARLLRIARHMEQLNQGIQMRARQPTSPDAELAPLSRMLTQEYQEMCQCCEEAAATLPDVGQADQLRNAVQRVGYACIDLIKATASGGATGAGVDPAGSQGTETAGGQPVAWMLSRNRAIAELDRRAEVHSARLHELIALLNAHGPGTQACLQSASTVSGIIADLDTTILFASSGTLHGPIHDDVDALAGGDMYQRHAVLSDSSRPLSIRPGETDQSMDNFEPIRDSIVRTARALVDDTHSLVSGTGEDQTRLASTAHVAVERVTQLADVVKRGAAILGPGQPDTQVELLRACRDAVSGLKAVFLSVSKLDGRPAGDPLREEALSNVQTTTMRLGSLIQKAVGISSDDLRGIQALTLAIKHCREQAAHLADPTAVPTTVGQAPAHTPATPVSSCWSAARMSATNVSVFSGSSSLVARYLAPDDLARFAGAPVQNAVSKAITTSRTGHQQDIVATANTTRDVVSDLTAATKALLRYAEAPPEKRNACAVAVKDLIDQFAELLGALKTLLFSGSQNAGDRDRVATAARRIADLSHLLRDLLDGLREGPRLIMYFRASSPEWRDVAEKFIGRHVAYHHHYVPNYSVGSAPAVTHQSVYVRPTCFPLPLVHSTRTAEGVQPREADDKADEVEKRIDAAIGQLESALSQHRTSDPGTVAPLLQSTHSAALAIKELVQTARSIGLTLIPARPVDRVRHGGGGGASSSAALWNAELTVSMAMQQMCQLSRHCSEAVTAVTSPDSPQRDYRQFDSDRLVPVRERLLAAVHQVAKACAQLLMSAKARKLACATADIKRLQVAGQAVKESTDRLYSTVQHIDFYGDTVSRFASARLPASARKATETMAEIHTRQAELAALREELDQLEQEQLRAHPGLFGDTSDGM